LTSYHEIQQHFLPLTFYTTGLKTPVATELTGTDQFATLNNQM